MDEKHNTVLVIDNDKDIVEAVYNILSDTYSVYRAYSEHEALEMLQNHPVDMIISDRRLPGHDRVLFTGHEDILRLADATARETADNVSAGPLDKDHLKDLVLLLLKIRLQKAFSERDVLKEQLIRSAKMASLGELVAGIVHEINNPLGFIHANMGNMKKFSIKLFDLIDSYDCLDVPEKIRDEVTTKKKDVKYSYLRTRVTELIERSMIGADRMKKIIQDVKSFARKDAADEFAEDDIHEAIDTTLTILHNEYKNRIEIKKEYGQLPPVGCYISKLNQVFVNLLANACQAIKDTGVISIKTGTEDRMVTIEISDSGSGIPKDVIDNIFDPFFTTKPEGVGTGLGLSIGHGIIKQHKGELSVKSSEGEGTTFTIKLPLNLKREDMDN